MHENSNGVLTENAQKVASQDTAKQSSESSLSKLPDANRVPELLKASAAICSRIHVWSAAEHDVKKQLPLLLLTY